MNQRDLIIDAPSLQTLRQRFVFSFITFIFWAAWFYLWLPLMTLIAWAFGSHLVYEHMVVLRGWEGLAKLLGFYAISLFLMGTIFIGWALYNNIRFRNKTRRGSVKSVSDDQLMDFYKVGPKMICTSQNSKRVVFFFSPEGDIVNLQCDLPMS